MSKPIRQGVKKASGEKKQITLDELNAARINFISSVIRHDFVRCLLKDGSVYCGFVKKMDKNWSSFELYYPYVEKKSPILHEQIDSRHPLTFDFDSVIIVTTHKTVDRGNAKPEPEKLSMGIMESLSMADPSLSSFNDSERRTKTKAGLRNRELQSNFGFLTEKGDKDSLDESGFQMGAYDQFAENRTKFGVNSEFDITMYTSHVDAGEVPLEIRLEAEQMEQEIKKMDGTNNLHLLEERGFEVNADEEEMYSKVHSYRQNKREPHRKHPKEEKVLSRSIMRHASRSEKLERRNSEKSTDRQAERSPDRPSDRSPEERPLDRSPEKQGEKNGSDKKSQGSSEKPSPAQGKKETKLSADAPEFAPKMAMHPAPMAISPSFISPVPGQPMLPAAQMNPPAQPTQPAQPIMQVNPQMIQMSPQMVQMSPQMIQMNPQMIPINPQMIQLNPQMIPLIPINPQMAAQMQQMQQMAPQMATQMTPQMTTPVNPQVTQQVNPQIAQQMATQMAPQMATQMAPQMAPQLATQMATPLTPQIVTPMAQPIAAQLVPQLTPQVQPQMQHPLQPQLTPQLTPQKHSQGNSSNAQQPRHNSRYSKGGNYSYNQGQSRQSKK